MDRRVVGVRVLQGNMEIGGAVQSVRGLKL